MIISNWRNTAAVFLFAHTKSDRIKLNFHRNDRIVAGGTTRGTTALVYYCSGYWEGGLRCALIRCTLGSGKSEKGWDFGGEGTRGQWGTKGNSSQATLDRGGRFLSQLEGAK